MSMVSPMPSAVQVFIRELISNASDALEKLRYMQLTGEAVEEPDLPLEIHIATNDDKKTFVIQVRTLSVWSVRQLCVNRRCLRFGEG